MSGWCVNIADPQRTRSAPAIISLCLIMDSGILRARAYITSIARKRTLNLPGWNSFRPASNVERKTDALWAAVAESLIEC